MLSNLQKIKKKMFLIYLTDVLGIYNIHTYILYYLCICLAQWLLDTEGTKKTKYVIGRYYLVAFGFCGYIDG